MTDKMIPASVILASVTVIAVFFIRHAQHHRKKLKERVPADFAPKRRGSPGQDNYESRYIYAPRQTFSSNRKIRIRPEYYERLRQVTLFSGQRNISLIAYLDNIIRAHFEENEEFIKHFCHKHDSLNLLK